jgi:hypothetical protein
LGPTEQVAGDEREHGERNDRVGDPERRTAAERQQLRPIRPDIVHHAVVRGDHGMTAGNRQHAERDHEGRLAHVPVQSADDGNASGSRSVPLRPVF